MKNNLGSNIYNFRKQKGLTQRDLSNILHISYQAVSKWERNISLPDPMLLPMIAEALGCSIDDLFGHFPK